MASIFTVDGQTAFKIYIMLTGYGPALTMAHGAKKRSADVKKN
jgi:hypothetical protein